MSRSSERKLGQSLGFSIGSFEQLAQRDAIVVEDEPYVGDLIQTLVEECGLECRRAASGEAAEELVAARDPNLILLDLRLPGQSGQEFLTRYRKLGGDAPVIIISALDDILVRVAMLAAGADDFIQKPFQNKEVQARIRAVLRRSRSQRYLWCNDGHFRLDPVNGRASFAGNFVELTPTEFGIVWLLAASRGRPVNIEELCQQLFGDALPHTVTNCHPHISKARKKLERLSPMIRMPCIVGVGYLLNFSDISLRD